MSAAKPAPFRTRQRCQLMDAGWEKPAGSGEGEGAAAAAAASIGIPPRQRKAGERQREVRERDTHIEM